MIIAGMVTAGTGWVIRGATPALHFVDQQQAVLDDSALISVECDDVGDGSEDCDFTIGVVEGGAQVLSARGVYRVVVARRWLGNRPGCQYGEKNR